MENSHEALSQLSPMFPYITMVQLSTQEINSGTI